MAVIETTRTARPGVAMGSVFSRFVAAFAAWNEKRVTRNALYRLTDRELDDIGLTRADIERAIR